MPRTQKSDQDRGAGGGCIYCRGVRDQSESSEHDSCRSRESVSLRRGVRAAIYRAWELNGPEIVVSAFARLPACGDTYAITLREHIGQYTLLFFFLCFLFRKNLLHGFAGTLLRYSSCFFFCIEILSKSVCFVCMCVHFGLTSGQPLDATYALVVAKGSSRRCSSCFYNRGMRHLFAFDGFKYILAISVF